MLNRGDDRFRTIAELVEGSCRKAGVEVHPGIVDALIRRRIAMADRGRPAGRTALLSEPMELGALVADELIEAARLLRPQRTTPAPTTRG
jgi:hypothetical protein